jgi:hypothetical protein
VKYIQIEDFKQLQDCVNQIQPGIELSILGFRGEDLVIDARCAVMSLQWNLSKAPDDPSYINELAYRIVYWMKKHTTLKGFTV